MSRFSKTPSLVLLFVFAVFVLDVSADFYTDVNLYWGGNRAKIGEGGRLLQLTLDRVSGSGFTSKREYLFGKIDMQIKMVPGNSAGTVTAYYLSSQGPTHDEIDFEFLGNVSGEPYILHTNVFSQGKGGREQQFYLWFDPRLAFHTYSIVWNPQLIIFLVDGTPIRVFRNLEGRGVPYLKSQPMRLYASLWDADEWATRGGLVKTDWSHAPFAASFRGFAADTTRGSWWTQSLDSAATQKLQWVRKNYMIYNYCTDYRRFPQGFPPECSFSG